VTLLLRDAFIGEQEKRLRNIERNVHDLDRDAGKRNNLTNMVMGALTAFIVPLVLTTG